MKKLFAAAILGATVMMAASTAVSADKIITFDPNVVMETPNSDWHEIKDPDTTITLTDGEDIVKVNRFSFDDELPKPVVKSEKFAEIYQTYYTTENNIYMITGYAVDKEGIDEVRAVVESISLVDHAKPEEEKTEEKKSEEKKDEKKEENALTKTGRVDGIYLDGDAGNELIHIDEYSDGSWKDRNGKNYWLLETGKWTDDFGNIYYNEDSIANDGPEMTGITMYLYNESGAVEIEKTVNDTWYGRNDHCRYENNGDGTWTNLVTGVKYWEETDAPAASPTDKTKTLYYDADGSELVITKYTDGTWKDSNGHDYWQVSENGWECDGGEYLVDYPSINDSDVARPTDITKTLYFDADGSPIEITKYTDGTWKDPNGYDVWQVSEHYWELDGGEYLSDYTSAQ